MKHLEAVWGFMAILMTISYLTLMMSISKQNDVGIVFSTLCLISFSCSFGFFSHALRITNLKREA